MEKDIEIHEVKELLEHGYKVEVSSPNGFVEITDFIEKGYFEVYHLNTFTKKIGCNINHKWLTSEGFKKTSELLDGPFLVAGEDEKFIPAHITKSDKIERIVDVTVDHPSHTYFTDGIASHNSCKTLTMCSMATHYLQQGYDVLYITMEMAETKIASRIDANLLDVDINRVTGLSEQDFMGRINLVKTKGMGQLVIKEYPTGSAHCGHFDSLMKELKIKKNFVPKIIFVDYLGICSSKLVSPTVGMYSYVKSIAEELRSFMGKHNAVGFSVAQFNRGGTNNTDADYSNIAESTGIQQTADFIAGLILTEELEEKKVILVKQIKNRYGDVAHYKKFLVGLDKTRMRVYDTEQDWDEDNDSVDDEDDIPEFDKATKGRTLEKDGPMMGGISF